MQSHREGLIVLGKHLNDVCKLSEFAVQGFQTICLFFRCFQIFFFNSVKYFNKPKPCGFFFLDALTVPPPHPTLHVILVVVFSQHFFQLFVHLTSVWFFVRSICGYILPLNSSLIYSVNIFNKRIQQILLFWEFPKIILGIKKIHTYNLNNFINN